MSQTVQIGPSTAQQLGQPTTPSSLFSTIRGVLLNPFGQPSATDVAKTITAGATAPQLDSTKESPARKSRRNRRYSRNSRKNRRSRK